MLYFVGAAICCYRLASLSLGCAESFGGQSAAAPLGHVVSYLLRDYVQPTSQKREVSALHARGPCRAGRAQNVVVDALNLNMFLIPDTLIQDADPAKSNKQEAGPGLSPWSPHSRGRLGSFPVVHVL